MPLIQGGALIRNARQPTKGGTLTCVVVARDDPRRRYLLTAAHVIGMSGYARRGDAIEAKLPGEPGWVKVAEFETAVKLRDAVGVQQLCDAALARITDSALVSDEIEGVGIPSGTASQLYEDMHLKFRGAASGLVTGARVQSLARLVPITYRDPVGGGTYTLAFKNQVVYGMRQGDVWMSATQPVDSGALILDQDGLAVGMHIGRTPDDFDVAASVCTPIRTVLAALDVMLPGDAATTTSVPPGQVAAPAVQGPDLISQRSFADIGVSLRSLMEPHNDFGGVLWQLTRAGLVVGGRIDRSPGAPVTVPRVLQAYGPDIEAAALKHKVPVELIVATICAETSGRSDAIRIEPGYVSDSATPHRVSCGLMQTLISTAREATGNSALVRDDLLNPATSIDAGTAYINQQRTVTRLDPPQVACAYNAGGLYLNRGEANRWKLKQYPIGTGAHADRFTKWFNDCFATFAADPSRVSSTVPSFFRLLAGG